MPSNHTANQFGTHLPAEQLVPDDHDGCAARELRFQAVRPRSPRAPPAARLGRRGAARPLQAAVRQVVGGLEGAVGAAERTAAQAVSARGTWIKA